MTTWSRLGPWLGLALAMSGCARDLARVSSGTIGCPTDEIEISDVSIGWSETSWIARCRGTTFTCAGEQAPSCVPERASSAELRPEPASP